MDEDNAISLFSPAFEEGGSIPDKFTCRGDNVSPELNISGASNEAKSMALIMHDPDAPVGDWVHWTVWDIEPSTTKINENSSPQDSVQGVNSFDKNGWGGPCPPEGTGTHRYVFELYALDTKIDLSDQAKRDELGQAMQGHILQKTTLTGVVASS